MVQKEDLNILLIRLNCQYPSLGDLSSFCSANWIFCPLLCSLRSDLSNIKGAEEIPMMLFCSEQRTDTQLIGESDAMPDFVAF